MLTCPRRSRRNGTLFGLKICGSGADTNRRHVFDITLSPSSDATYDIAQEFAPHGITVNAYAPGVILTAMSMSTDQLFGMPPDTLA